MGQRVAVAIIHGIGRTEPDFADGMMADLRRRVSDGGAAAIDLVMKPVFWSPVFQAEEDELSRRTKAGGPTCWRPLREFMVSFAGDAVAYQPVPGDRGIYDKVHQVAARTFRALSEEAGPKAPLCVIAHSLGTVIASNYLYDLQTHPTKKLIADHVLAEMRPTPLEKGETLTLFYTLGSPIALWGLRYPDYGKPVQVPSPDLARHWPGIVGEWVNFYDKDDVLGYPLKKVNAAYGESVTRDRAVDVGSIWTGWTPMSHEGYWTDKKVTRPIARALVDVWKAVNP